MSEDKDDTICLVYDSDDLLGSQEKARAAGAAAFMVLLGESANIAFWVNAVSGNAPYRTGLVLHHAYPEAPHPLEQDVNDISDPGERARLIFTQWHVDEAVTGPEAAVYADRLLQRLKDYGLMVTCIPKTVTPLAGNQRVVRVAVACGSGLGMVLLPFLVRCTPEEYDDGIHYSMARDAVPNGYDDVGAIDEHDIAFAQLNWDALGTPTEIT